MACTHDRNITDVGICCRAAPSSSFPPQIFLFINLCLSMTNGWLPEQATQSGAGYLLILNRAHEAGNASCVPLGRRPQRKYCDTRMHVLPYHTAVLLPYFWGHTWSNDFQQAMWA